MTHGHPKTREEAQQFRSFYDRMDELIEILLAYYHPSSSPEGCTSSKPLSPSTPEAVQSAPPASTTPEIEQQAVPTDPVGTREDGRNEA
jgi:hypothetical protein